MQYTAPAFRNETAHLYGEYEYVTPMHDTNADSIEEVEEKNDRRCCAYFGLGDAEDNEEIGEEGVDSDMEIESEDGDD